MVKKLLTLHLKKHFWMNIAVGIKLCLQCLPHDMKTKNTLNRDFIDHRFYYNGLIKIPYIMLWTQLRSKIFVTEQKVIH